MTTEVFNVALMKACAAWQTDREHSSRICAAARVITGVPHYFQTPLVHEHEAQARDDHSTLVHASTLMTTLVKATLRTADEWRAELEVPGSGCAALGIDPAVDAPDVDGEIERAVTRPGATLNMPLWGFSLDEQDERQAGQRFLFRLHGKFSALPAWKYSRIKDAEQQMIGGGAYRVLGTTFEEATLVVDLKQLAVPMYAAHDLDQLLVASGGGDVEGTTE